VNAARSQIGPDTRVYMSFSSRPGRFGAVVYNTLFAREGIDAVYLPRSAPDHPEEIVACVRSLGLAGCSVSSPYKVDVLPLLDELEPDAERAGAVNTVYRGDDDRLVGACTDIDGVSGCLGEACRELAVRSATVFGSGGVVGPAIVALRRLGIDDIRIASRNADAGRTVSERFEVRFSKDLTPSDLVINATPAGVESPDVPILTSLLESARLFLDMTVSPAETAIVAHARGLGVVVCDGVDMCTTQVTSQARRYLGRSVDPATIREIVETRYLKRSV